MKRWRACLVVVLCVAATIAGAEQITAFSRMVPGVVTGGWQLQTIRGRAAADFRVVDEEGAVVEATSNGAVGSLIHAVDAAVGAGTTLSWRWRVDNAIDGSTLYKKSGDDFPARVYALFDYEPGRLPFGTRWKLRLARLLYGKQLPAAALCYVPSDEVPPETILPSAYTDRVRMIVVDGVAPGEWRSFERDVAADFAAAFGEEAPALAGIAIAIDTDDTGADARTRFGDVLLE